MAAPTIDCIRFGNAKRVIYPVSDTRDSNQVSDTQYM